MRKENDRFELPGHCKTATYTIRMCE